MLECVISVQFTKICRNDAMTRAKKNPQKTHVEWVQIQDATLQLVTKMEQEIIELKAKITLLENEKLSKEKEADEFFEKKERRYFWLPIPISRRSLPQNSNYKPAKTSAL